ncbi:MAG: tetratricopeptide repeat protein [Brevundimonas sp.]|nr:tetratricopeptide repeat protein [Brevundimonas sp.]MDI6625285.1 tetratricopeptide repeat protein [Brevundimonas sp.]MDQ7812483.1 tetratricopeptide repeat protein [Brevundimonas sp.]
MGEGEANKTDHGRSDRSRGPVAIAAIAGVLALTALGMASCGDGSGGIRFWQRADAGSNACPRPASLSGSEFNAQETGLRALRRAAFRGDFFAQLELGSRYAAIRATDKNIEDPIESATWYAMALANDEGYAPINRVDRGGFGGWRPLSKYDDCRAFERHMAYQRLDRQLGQMTREEQESVRDRVVYILSTQDAEGYRTLARLHDGLYGPFGEPEDNREAREAWGDNGGGASDSRNRRRRGYLSATSLFPRNDVDAYLYNYLAVQTGDVGAYVLMKDFEKSAPSRDQYSRFVEAKARQWTPPFEFYPNEAPASGVPFSDESRPRGDAYEYALTRMGTELPFIHVGRALRYLGITETAATRPEDLSKRQIETLEAMLGHPMESRLSYLERVRAIQLAAVNGSSEAQLVLAVMYAEGIGLPADYARAFKWFDEAARQGSPEAKFAMSSYFALGVSGVADQDKAQAVALRIDSALSGFGPSAARLQAVLAQVSRSQQRR